MSRSKPLTGSVCFSVGTLWH